jgi:glutathione peroxidase-family protein
VHSYGHLTKHIHVAALVDGKEVALSSFKGKVLLVVNVASA